MVQFDGEGVEEHFSVGIALNIISGFVEFFDDNLLLTYRGNFVEALRKIFPQLDGLAFSSTSLNWRLRV